MQDERRRSIRRFLNTKLLLAALLGALTPLVLSATSATADDADEKFYPGFMCLQAGSETGAFNRSDYRITRINSTGSGRLLCPIVRDRANPGTGYDTGFGNPARPTGFRARVRTYRTSTSGNLSCTLYARSSTGGTYSWDTEWANVGYQTTELWVRSSTSAGSYHLACDLPVNTPSGYTRLINYWVSE